jgi:L-threonylcarbamoyladenylate synthase
MRGTQIVLIDGVAIGRAASIVKGGGVIVFPTDTVYGLGCDPENEKAVGKLFEIKKRTGKPIPILCDGIESAEKLVRLNGASLNLALKYWPGALTILLPLKKKLPETLHQGTGELGVRVPDSADCIRLIRECGGFLTGTSANISGEAPACSAREAKEALGDTVDLILDGGKTNCTPSTVVRATPHGIEVLRRGGVRV